VGDRVDEELGVLGSLARAVVVTAGEQLERSLGERARGIGCGRRKRRRTNRVGGGERVVEELRDRPEAPFIVRGSMRGPAAASY